MSDRTCYFPAGNEAEGNVPCSGDKYTSCCGSGDLCLSNGLCMNINHQPYLLSRGGCTNQNWDQGCPEYCSKINPRGGTSIINLVFEDDTITYCCGTPVGTDNGTGTVCPDDQDAFTIADGTPLAGYAMLANVSSLSATNTSSGETGNCTATNTAEAGAAGAGSCHEAAVGAGVGVPLGLLALGAVAWAVFERMRAARMRSLGGGGVAEGAGYATVYTDPKPVAELEQGRTVHEMMGR
ncbi:hypothetical protein BDV25DRAFT_138669 [Aspergillus avenaceus]|uniref:Mid2 domain-containing protein n=1 Tax=Aspergillus avenaceus TaxID=36643 RepID=A0A5N6TZ82_ASPAV|nr:hypothetical protein BDV25DRAFT_138669 [Aspergillus avenaceus]